MEHQNHMCDMKHCPKIKHVILLIQKTIYVQGVQYEIKVCTYRVPNLKSPFQESLMDEYFGHMILNTIQLLVIWSNSKSFLFAIVVDLCGK